MTDYPLATLTFDELPPDLQELLKPTVERLGYFGDLFALLGHNPAVVKAFTGYSAALRPLIDATLNELVALTVCTRMQFDYERIQHERLSLVMKLDRAWVAALVGKGPLDPLSPAERSTRDCVLATVDGDVGAAREQIANVAADFGAAQATAILVQTTRFMGICQIGKIIGAQLPVPSPFATAG